MRRQVERRQGVPTSSMRLSICLLHLNSMNARATTQLGTQGRTWVIIIGGPCIGVSSAVRLTSLRRLPAFVVGRLGAQLARVHQPHLLGAQALVLYQRRRVDAAGEVDIPGEAAGTLSEGSAGVTCTRECASTLLFAVLTLPGMWSHPAKPAVAPLCHYRPGDTATCMCRIATECSQAMSTLV